MGAGIMHGHISCARAAASASVEKWEEWASISRIACRSAACSFSTFPIRVTMSANTLLFIHADLRLQISALHPCIGLQRARVSIVHVRSFMRITWGSCACRAVSSHMTATCVTAFRSCPRDACLAGPRPPSRCFGADAQALARLVPESDARLIEVEQEHLLAWWNLPDEEAKPLPHSCRLESEN